MMDNNIRNLIHVALEENNFNSLNEAYSKLKKERQSPSDKIDAVSPDLFTLCAETAFKLGLRDMAEDCIKMFFMKTPPSNQFLCRTYLCQAQLSVPTSPKKAEQLDKAVDYILKAINFARKNPRYYFLVYNASVLYWQFCRPFLKPSFRQYLARSLHQVVKALDDIDDKDYDWRAQLMIALIECHVDAGRKEDAVQVSNATLSFTKSYVPTLYTTVLGLQIRHRLIDISKVSKEIKASNELHIFYKIQRLRSVLEAGEKVDIHQELGKIYKMIVKGGLDTDRSSTEMSNTPVSNFASSPMANGVSDKVPLLIDLTRLCLENDCHELAADCLEILKGPTCIKDKATSFEVEFMKFDLMVKSLGNKKENYSKNVVETRLQAIKKLEQYLITASRLGNPNVIQAGCVTLWNLSLPLLQPNLRHHVRKPLTLVAQLLEDIDSLLVLLRCQVHMELAKCEEDEDQLEYALTHLQKALDMDDSSQYRDRLNTALKRLKLRATLYQTPERPEDLAAMIIEQARSSDDSSTVRMKRASLVKAGEALSPDAFVQVLDSESDTKDPSSTKGPPTLLSKLGGRASQYQKAVSKADGHLKRLGNENDQERVRIWVDLAKTARKQHVWDVTRVAARFCLLYDNGRWSKRGASGRSNIQSDSDVAEDRSVVGTTKSPAPEKRVSGDSNKLDPTGMKLLHPEGMTPFKKEQDIIRNLAEVHFIYAEGLVHLLRKEGVQLGDFPVPPEETVKLRPKRYDDQQLNVQEQPEWVTYCKWIESLSAEAIYSFQRAAELGVELNEPWLICNSAVYLWNYTNHILTQGRFKEIVPIYTPVLEAMKTTGHAGETELMCRLSNAIAQGLMQPWIPALPTQSDTTGKEKTDKQQPEKPAKGRQSGKGTKGVSSKTNVPNVSVDPEGTGDLKKAVDLLEFMMTLTNGNDPNNLVPIALRHPLIKSWVFCKQLLSQPIPKNLGHDDENTHSQGPMSKALCAVEMVSLQGNGLPELQPCPTLPEIVKMVETSTWSDRLVELEIWSRLAVLAYKNDNHSLVMHCGEKTMAFAASDQCLANKHPKKMDSVFKHKVVVEQEMLYFASVVMGQSLIRNMQGRNEIRRDALVCFVNACRFGQQASNYELVITAARHYWNAIKPFISEPIERELLKDPLEAVLGCVAAVAEKTMGKEDEEEDETDAPTETKTASKPKSVKSNKAGKDKKDKEKSSDKKKDKAKVDKNKIGKSGKVDSSDGKGTEGKQDQESKTASLPSAFDEELMMRAAMYGVLFQAYADKCDWKQGLRAMDQAVKDMPRTHHRLLIFKHRVITNAKLGRNVLFDMGKFKNESDDVISSMWRHVALNSKDPLDQLTAYQNAIEVLESPESDWQKVEYLVEFGEWLFVNEYPKTDAMDQFLWAADILINKTSKEGVSPTLEREGDGMSDTSSPNATKYVPRRRESVIGQRPSEIAIKTEEMTDVRQLETLCRIHVMLAQVAGRSSPHYADYILISSGFVHRILEISIHSAEKMIREGGKPGERAPSKKGKDKKESQSKSEKAGSRSCLPLSMEAWSTFELPEKLQEYFKQDITGSMISKNSIKKPMLAMYYLNTLVNDLGELGYHQLGLPVLVMSQVIADLILEQEHLQRLVHLRIMQLCQQLNLLSGASLHERLTGNLYLTEQEQAKSREEIEIWKEKQRQVSIEEERTRATKSIIFDHKPSNLDNRSRGPGLANSDVEYEPWNKYKTVISGVKNREVWTAQAEILINQGHYQVARQLLYEANISARAFEDHSTLAKILVQLAVLALAESNWGQAISFLKEAQSLKGDQKFWLQTTLLLVEACLYKIDKRSQNPNKPDKEALEKARGIIVDAKSLFQGLSEENENKANLSDYIEAILEARHGILLFDYLVNDESKEKDEETLMNCDNAYQYLRGAREKLAQLGYRREAARVMRKQAAIKRMLADGAKTTDERHEYFLQAYSILMEATNIADAVMYDAQQASPLYEMRMVSLPVQREAVDVHLDLTDLMVSMFLCYSQEDRNRRQLEARKGSMQKMIDDFVKSEAVLCSEEKQEWKDTCSSLAVDAMMQLSLVSGMTNGLPHLRAKVMHSLGVCLRALSAHSSPDADNQWKELEQNRTLDLEKETIENQSQESKENSQGLDGVMKANTNESREILKYTTQAFNLNRVYTTSRKYLCQAVECLSQAVQIALKGGLRDIVSQASHQLVECIGTHDPASSAQYLALYQSCYMSQCLEKVLYRAQADPAVSRLAALLRQRKFFSTVDYLTKHSSAVVSLNHNNLGDCEAWRRLSIMKNHLELTKEFSVTNLQFVVLQHSPDRRYLYGAVLDKGRSAVASAKPAKQAGAVPVPTKAVVTRAEVNPKDLDDLIEEFNHFKSDTATELTRRNFVCHQHERQQKMLDRVEEHPTSNQESNSIMIDTALEHQEAKLQSHFQDVLAAMEAYLDPVLTKLYPALNAESMSGTIVLLADDKLLLLPLESLSAFLTPRVTSLTRDFSLQFLYHRFHQNEENEHKGDAKKGGGKKGDKKPEKPSTAKSKPSDKKGGTKDAAAGVPKDGPVVDVNNLRYIVDLHNECSDEEDSPVKVMTDIITHHKTFSGKWTGAMGSDHLPSIGEFQRLLHESSVFLFYGTERCLGSLPPNMLCPMNLTECNVAFIMDLVQTNSSFLRQSRDDSAKTVSEISLEDPLECAMLFSLAGVGCVLTNTWHGQLQDNKNKLIKYFTVLLEDSKPIGQALRSLIEFPKPSEVEQDAECSSEKGSKHGNGARKDSKAPVQNPLRETELHMPSNQPLAPAPRQWFNTVLYGAPTFLFNPAKTL